MGSENADERRRRLAFAGLKFFADHLVGHQSMEGALSYVMPDLFPHRVKVARDFNDVFPLGKPDGNTFMLENQVDEKREGKRFCTRPNEIAENNIATSGIPPNLVRTKPLDGDEKMVGDDHVSRMVKDYVVGDNVYHDCEDEGGTYGVPSAFIIEKKGE